MRIEEMTLDEVALRPSRLQLPALVAAMQAAGANPTSPAQRRELTEKMAAIYEGIRIGAAEMRGLSADVPEGKFKLSAFRFNLEDGKIGEFAFEGIDTGTPQGPVKVGRFALKSVDIANVIRVAAQFSNPAQPPSPDQLLGLVPLIQGVEVKGVTAPFKNTGKSVKLDGFDLNWGQFVGPIPSKARLTAKMTTPIDARDPAMAKNQADFTLTFRRLIDAAGNAGDDGTRAQFTDPAAFDEWAPRWRQRLAEEPQSAAERQAAMRAVNPAFIPRNHRVEAVIAAAVNNDYAPFEELLTVLSKPYEDQPSYAAYADPPLPDQRVLRTFCGT